MTMLREPPKRAMVHDSDDALEVVARRRRRAVERKASGSFTDVDAVQEARVEVHVQVQAADRTVTGHATSRPRIRRGTVRIRESVPPRRTQTAGFATVRILGTVRSERARPAESAANGLASGDECGAIFLSSPTNGEGR